MDIKVELSRIIINEESDKQLVVLKEIDGDRGIPIVIGIVEIFAIDRRLKGIAPMRPMTHDLLNTVIEELGASIVKVVINDLRDHTFYARLFLAVDDQEIEIDCRPSDAIALSVAQNAPIWVADHVLDEAGQ
jgi:uncharacterized protein